MVSIPTFQCPGIWVISPEEFLRGELSSRGCRWLDERDGRFTVEFPEDPSRWFRGRQRVACWCPVPAAADSAENAEAENAEAGSPSKRKRIAAGVDSEFFAWVVQTSRSQEALGDAATAQPIGGVRELTDRLFASYQVDPGVAVQLGGCTLEDHPALCLTYLQRSSGDVSGGVSGDLPEPRIVRVFFDTEGDGLDSELVEDLGLLHWTAADWRHARARYPKSHWEQAIRRGEEQFQAMRSGEDEHFERLSATRVWSTFVEGRIHFLAGEITESVPFADWARRIIQRPSPAPPFRCPHTGTTSYHVSVTDDDKISAARCIASCEVSNQRLLESELGTCELTGQKVHEQLLACCPVTGHRLLKTERAVCQSCQQHVWPDCVRSGRCLACRQMQPIEKSDPRLVRILGEYPKLDEWRRWKISETETAYILIAQAWLRRLLIVLDKDTLAPLHEANGTLFSKDWRTSISGE